MKIFICLRRHDAMRKARDWFCAKSNYAALEEITGWARGQEAKWGECFVMIEVDVPGSHDLNARNVDFIVAFDDRVAVIEVKNHRGLRAALASLPTSLRQCCGSLDLVSAHLATVVHDKAIRPFLYIPQLTSTDIAQLTAQQLSNISLTHPTIVGGARCKVQPSLPNGHPLYIATALKSRMGQISNSDPRRFTRNAQAVLLGFIDPSERAEFSALDRAVADLARHAGTPSVLRLGESYIRGLRPNELKQFRERLQSSRVVVVSGATGIGKSDFIREALEALVAQEKKDLPLAVIDIKAEQTLVTMCRDVLNFFDQDPSDCEIEETITERVIQTKGLIWVQSYEVSATPLVARLINALASSSDSQCRLIVESTVAEPSSHALVSSEQNRVHLFRLDVKDILRILSTLQSGHPQHNPATVTANSRGNPRLAITRWRSSSSASTPDWLASEFAWVERAFTDPKERAVCSLVVAVLDEYPIEVSPFLLEAIACAAFRGLLPSTVKAAVTRVLSTLDSSQVLMIRRINGSDFRVLGGRFSSLDIARVSRLNPSLAEYVVGQTDVARLGAWKHEALSVLQLQGHLKHAQVLSGLLRSEMTPWFASSYRQGFLRLKDIVNWADRRILDRGAASIDELYLERTLRAALEMVERSNFTIVKELDEPPSDGWPRYAYDLLTEVAGYCSDSKPLKLDLDVVDDGPALDRLVESLCWVYRLRPLSFTTDSWSPFKKLVEVAHRLSPPVRLLFYYHVLLYAMFCGQRFIEQPGVKTILTDICFDMAPLAVTEDLFYLMGAHTFFEALLDDRGTKQHEDVVNSTFRLWARSADLPKGSSDQTAAIFNHEFWTK